MLRKMVLLALLVLGLTAPTLAFGYRGGFYVYQDPVGTSLERYTGGFFVYRYTGGFFLY